MGMDLGDDEKKYLICFVLTEARWHQHILRLYLLTGGERLAKHSSHGGLSSGRSIS